MIPSEYLGTQHRLLVLDLEFKCSERKKRSVGDPRVKWWNLTKENVRNLSERITEAGAWRQAEDADVMWDTMLECIQRSGKKILGTYSRGGYKMKGSWWWNDEVVEKVKEKKRSYAVFMNSGMDEEKEMTRVRYKAIKKATNSKV